MTNYQKKKFNVGGINSEVIYEGEFVFESGRDNRY